MTRFFNAKTWTLILGIGVGITLGVIFASGFQFDRSDSARFIGALLGSLIAVSGAVALHYLKEIESRNDRRRHLIALLNTARAFGVLAIADLHDEENASVAAETFHDQFMRAYRFAEKYEFEDYAIGECGSILAINNVKLLLVKDDEPLNDKLVQVFKEIIEASVGVIDSGLDALDGSDKELANLK